jgi:hypothetical protein
MRYFAPLFCCSSLHDKGSRSDRPPGSVAHPGGGPLPASNAFLSVVLAEGPSAGPTIVTVKRRAVRTQHAGPASITSVWRQSQMRADAQFSNRTVCFATQRFAATLSQNLRDERKRRRHRHRSFEPQGLAVEYSDTEVRSYGTAAESNRRSAARPLLLRCRRAASPCSQDSLMAASEERTRWLRTWCHRNPNKLEMLPSPDC